MDYRRVDKSDVKLALREIALSLQPVDTKVHCIQNRRREYKSTHNFFDWWRLEVRERHVVVVDCPAAVRP